jgi:hypothetical protein
VSPFSFPFSLFSLFQIVGRSNLLGKHQANQSSVVDHVVRGGANFLDQLLHFAVRQVRARSRLAQNVGKLLPNTKKRQTQTKKMMKTTKRQTRKGKRKRKRKTSFCLDGKGASSNSVKALKRLEHRALRVHLLHASGHHRHELVECDLKNKKEEERRKERRKKKKEEEKLQ